MGGIGLTCVYTKSRTLLIKNMNIEIEENQKLNIFGINVYGNMQDMDLIKNNNVSAKSLRDIYMFLLQEKIGTADNPIPSRSEKKNPRIIWKNSWKNWSRCRGVTPQLKQFGWNLIHDMVHVPSRNHRKNTSKDCRNLIYDEELDEMVICNNFGNLRHTLAECQITRTKFLELQAILNMFLGKQITTEQIIFISFSHFDRKKMKMAVWMVISSLHYIFKNSEAGCADMRRVIKEDLRFHAMREKGFVPKKYILEILEILENW